MRISSGSGARQRLFFPPMPVLVRRC